MSPEVMQAYAAQASTLGMPVRVVLEQMQPGGSSGRMRTWEMLELEMSAGLAAVAAERERVEAGVPNGSRDMAKVGETAHFDRRSVRGKALRCAIASC